MLTDDEIEAVLANITPVPWRYEAGGGHAPNCIRGSESVQVNGWKERVRLPDGSSIGNASYTDRVCENMGDMQHGGPSYNVALICAAPDMARELLAARAVLKAARTASEWLNSMPSGRYGAIGELNRRGIKEAISAYDEATR